MNLCCHKTSSTLNVLYHQANFKIYERAYHDSKFSGEWLRGLNLVVC
ncbi:hypothetical protein [Campylobacter concisus]|nr:hypothetical protein [Campylobacter concisus]